MHKKLIEELQNIDNEVTNDTVDDILWNYHELMNENFTKLKNLTKDNEKTIVRTIMNSCLNCTCVTQNYMIEE